MIHIKLPIFDENRCPRGHETLEVEPVGSCVKLLHSPAFIDGIAAGDIVQLDSETESGFTVKTRSGNICIIVAFKDSAAKAAHGPRVSSKIEALGGLCEGGPRDLLVLTVPHSAGLKEIESAVSNCRVETPTFEWWFGNVWGTDHPPTLHPWLSQSDL